VVCWSKQACGRDKFTVIAAHQMPAEKQKMKYNAFFGATYVLSLWVGFLAARAAWRQTRAMSEYGIWGVSNISHQVFFVGLLLASLSIGLVWAFNNRCRAALPVFCVIATSVVTPLIFNGTAQTLNIFGYNYYGGFDWIAPRWIQFAWLGLVILASLDLLIARINGTFHPANAVNTVETPREIWMTALYWLITIWFTILALNPISELVYDLLHPLAARRDDPVPIFMYDIHRLAMPAAIALALWLRSKTALWLVIIALLSSYNWVRFFELGSYWPAQNTPFFNHSKSFFLSHPMIKLLEIGLVYSVIRDKKFGHRA
jgi:hypothetical protein